MQPRDKLVLEFWDRSDGLSVKNKEYRRFVKNFFSVLLEADIKNGDITTSSLIEKNKKISAEIIGKEPGILAGLEELNFLNKGLNLKLLKKDGDKVRNDEVIAEIRGTAGEILSKERTNLNLLQRMSGIATLADLLNTKLSNCVKIAATRKTLWGLLDKKAVSLGNGLTHRLNLNDGILIKENHLKLIDYDFGNAINSAKSKSKYIEIEVEEKEQALLAAKAIKNAIRKNNNNLFAIMLDKISPLEIKEIIDIIKEKKLYESILFEASGNINGNNIKKYSDCGVDVISMGPITNSVKVLNMSLEIK